mgnify:CR=1 FL=1
MAVTPASTRMAMASIQDIQKLLSGMATKSIGEKVSPMIGEAATQFVGPAVGLAAAGLTAGAERLMRPAMQSSSRSNVSFAHQAYSQGPLPLTNEQAGDLYLQQVRMQNQLALIRARQEAASPQFPRIPTSSEGIFDLNQALQKTYTYG